MSFKMCVCDKERDDYNPNMAVEILACSKLLPSVFMMIYCLIETFQLAKDIWRRSAVTVERFPSHHSNHNLLKGMAKKSTISFNSYN